MVIVKDIYNEIDKIAPFSSAMDFDNVGLLLGSWFEQVKNVVVSLDVTEATITEATTRHANLIISHHPIILKPLKRCLAEHIAYLTIKNGINVICAHTNLDFAETGVCKCLAEVLGLRHIIPLCFYQNKLPTGLIGELPLPLNSKKFAQHVKDHLGCPGVRYTESSKPIKRVALCSGAAGEYIFDAIKEKADAFITGEIKHHEMLEAKKNGITTVTAGHFCSENIFIPPLIDTLSKAFPTVKFYASNSKSFELFL